jgi:hypothetical protein
VNAYIFVGPTISPDAARAFLDAVYVSPAAQGDVYLVACKRPRVIGIVDGFFEHVPAVWHKEILWALAQGIDVFGSSSMGALRAVELSPFGMEGIGQIFEWYRDGLIEDDDEVALAHGPAERAYAPASEPMVNVRATMVRAEREGIVSPSTATAVIAVAKELHYSERIYPTVLAGARGERAAASEIAALERWLPTGRIDQKRLDAIELLRAVRARLAAPRAPRGVAFSFERTVFWQRLERSVGAAGIEAATRVPTAVLLDELRLDPSSYARARDGVILRELALVEAERQGLDATDEGIARALDEFRERHRLVDEADLERWLRGNVLSRAELDALLREETILRLVCRRLLVRALRRLPDYLRVTGKLTSVLADALRRQTVLAEHGLDRPRPEDVGMSMEDVVESYLQQVRPSEASESVAEYVSALQEICDDLPGLLRSALRQLCYQQLVAGSDRR